MCERQVFNRFFRITVILGVLLMLSSCAITHPNLDKEEYFEVTVVDEVTQEPIEGVLMLAYWPTKKRRILFGSSSIDGVAKAAEAFSDENGVVRVRSSQYVPWGVPGLYVEERKPIIVLFKRGYAAHEFHNQGKGSRHTGWLEDAVARGEEPIIGSSRGWGGWMNGRTIILPRSKNREDWNRGFRGKLQEIAIHWKKKQGSLKEQLPNTLEFFRQYDQETVDEFEKYFD